MRRLPALVLVAMALAAATALSGPGAPAAAAATPVAAIAASALTVEAGSPLELRAEGLEPGAAAAWELGDGTTAAGPVVSHAWAAAGAYTVTLTVAAADGSVATATAAVTVTAPAAPGEAQLPPVVRPVATASDARVEQGELVLFTTTFSDGPATWIFGDGARTTGTRVWHRFRRPGTFSVILVVTDAYGRRSSTRLEIVVTRPGETSPAPVVVPSGDNLPTLRGPTQRSRKDPLYSAAASRLAGGPRAVLCWSEEHWAVLSRRASQRPGIRLLGYVDLRRPRRVNLSPGVCAQLDALSARPGRAAATFALANAIDTLAHETIHTTGVRNEAATECFAMQRLDEVARSLGAGEALIARLVTVLWREYSEESMPDGYWSSQCRDGGELDLDPGSRRFP